MIPEATLSVYVCFSSYGVPSSASSAVVMYSSSGWSRAPTPVSSASTRPALRRSVWTSSTTAPDTFRPCAVSATDESTRRIEAVRGTRTTSFSGSTRERAAFDVESIRLASSNTRAACSFEPAAL